MNNTILNMFIKSPAKWKLIRIDNPDDYVEGQFGAEDFVRNIEESYARMALNKREPGVAWTGSESRTITFKATFWNESSLPIPPINAVSVIKAVATGEFGLTATAKIKRLIGYTQKDKKTGAPPLLRFTWGDGDIRGDCFIESLGGIKYEELWANGAVKGISFDIRLLLNPPAIEISPIDPSAGTLSGFSLQKPVVEGESYESLAMEEYGNPLYGTILRQENTTAFPATGDVVHLPDKSYFTRKGLAPQDYSLAGATDAETALIQVFAERGTAAMVPLVVQ